MEEVADDYYEESEKEAEPAQEAPQPKLNKRPEGKGAMFLRSVDERSHLQVST